MTPAATIRTKPFWTQLPPLLLRAFRLVLRNDPLRMAGATAFFTSFALPFVLILLLQFLGLLVNPDVLRHQLFGDLAGIIGRDSMRQVVNTLRAFRHLAQNGWITAFGFLFLIMVSTTLLMVIKGSINQLWRIRVVERRSFVRQLGARLQSVSVILLTGILILVSIAAEAAKAFLGKNIGAVMPHLSLYLNSVLNHTLSLLFVMLWFCLIFRLLPDGRPKWRVAFGGAFLTAVLFTIGKNLLRVLLINSNLGVLYGASASVVLILLFVFYSSLIMYFGAAFTRVLGEHLHQPIRPRPFAAAYKVTVVKDDGEATPFVQAQPDAV